MTKPEGIEQWAWDRAETALVLSDWPRMVRDDFDNARPIIARAIQDAVMQERDQLKSDLIEIIEPYTRVSSLHNYGPSGLSRVEQAEIRTGTFIMEDVLSLFPKPSVTEANE